ncbi:MAG: gluconate 2-dehydrogenase subunit 3 family protein [Terriglobia bacterium]
MSDQAANPDTRPIDPENGKPIGPVPQPGYYAGFSTLAQRDFWDEATRKVVMARIEKTPPIRFFTAEQARLLKSVADRLLPQDDRDDAHKIPIVNAIDERLYENRLDGYRYEGMPPDQEAYRLGLQGIQAAAGEMYGKSFIALGPFEQDSVLREIHHGHPKGGEEIWQRMPVHRFWFLMMQDVLEAYYAHPYAWDEIGFGGPAYPRGYMRLERGEPEPWEARERRYAWQAPVGSLSGAYDPVAGTFEHLGVAGQGGTH